MEILNGVKRKINRFQNRQAVRNKIFCIGLHKTGTTTLARLFQHYGFKSYHAVDWQNNAALISKYDFFSDGGSHFDDQLEINFRKLAEDYPNAKFVLQTRQTKPWIVSKLKHAGWNSDTQIEPDDPSKIVHEEWRYKSLLTIREFIEHKMNYEKKVRMFFAENLPGQFIAVDITNADKQNELNRLRDFFNVKSTYPINLPHSNRAPEGVNLPSEVLVYIENLLTNRD